jgi:hypothetical protein
MEGSTSGLLDTPDFSKVLQQDSDKNSRGCDQIGNMLSPGGLDTSYRLQEFHPHQSNGYAVTLISMMPEDVDNYAPGVIRFI